MIGLLLPGAIVGILTICQTQFQSLRCKLQNGLLIEGQPPRDTDMDAMSLCLKELEGFADPPEIIMTRISTLLWKINKIETVPREDELHIQRRAMALYERYHAILNPRDQAAGSATPQPPSQVASQDQTADSSTFQLTTQALSPSSVIDLTESSDSEESPQLANDHGFGIGKSLRTQTGVTLSNILSGSHSQILHTAASFENLVRGTTNTDHNSITNTASNVRKRKLPGLALLTKPSTGQYRPPTLARSSKSVATIETSPLGRIQARRQRKQKTSFQGYMRTKSLWMNDSKKRIKELLKLDEEEIKLVDKKKYYGQRNMLLKITRRGITKQ